MRKHKNFDCLWSVASGVYVNRRWWDGLLSDDKKKSDIECQLVMGDNMVSEFTLIDYLFLIFISWVREEWMSFACHWITTTNYELTRLSCLSWENMVRNHILIYLNNEDDDLISMFSSYDAPFYCKNLVFLRWNQSFCWFLKTWRDVIPG